MGTPVSPGGENLKGPDIVTTPPGTKAQAIVDGDHEFLMTSTKTSPIVGVRGEGSMVEDVDGNVYIDFTSGIGVTNTGHCHPRVVEAITEQAKKLHHFAGTDFYYDAQVSLARKLVDIAPGDHDKKIFFTNSGTESVEAAIKITRWHTQRQHHIAFVGAFHGRTMGSLGLTASKPVHKDRFFPWMPGVVHVPYPNRYRPVAGVDTEDLTTFTIDLIEKHLDAYMVDQVASIFVEPVQGEGGYVIPPDDFLPALQRLAADRGIPTVADEVQAGFGRTGKMFASENFGFVPDLVTMAKGMGSGMPIGAVAARAEMDFGVQGAHSNTYGGNLVASAAAEATIDVIQEENLCDNAIVQGKLIMQRLTELQERFPKIGDVRGLGLMIAAEFVKDTETKEYAADLRNRIVEESYKRGLILLPCGRSAIRFIPPLVINEEEVTAAMDVFDEAVAVASK